MPTYRTVIASGEGLRHEYTADAAILPGDLLLVTTTGVARHPTADVRAGALFAIENEIFGRGVEVAYAAADRVLAEACTPGMMVNANLAAAAAAIVKGDYITSAGNGTVKKGLVANGFAIADEAVDNSGAGTATRIRIRII